MQNIADDDGSLTALLGRSECPAYHRAIELIGRRWNGMILRELVRGSGRFSDLRDGVEGITDAMLTQRLRELEDAGLVVRQVLDQRPVAVRYALTKVGAELAPILNSIATWSNEWSAAVESD